MNLADTASLPVTPLARYRAEIARSGWEHDPAQEDAARHLDALHRRLVTGPRPGPGLLDRLRGRTRVRPVRGIYLWGPTGRGKTWLADLFYQCLPFPEKLRRHFHRFMADVHEELKALTEHEDPLARVADGLARRVRVICFDEFFVSDIADAMILGRLFEHLFGGGVTLVATSNVPTQELYRDGLQRARFLPAIALLEAHTEVVPIGGTTDYRFRLLERAPIYLAPADVAADARLAKFWESAAPEDTRNRGALRVLGREIPVRGRADGVAWFEFADICGGPRSPADYIEVARSFHTVLVSGVPALTHDNENEARRFIALVDELYDRRVKLVVSAALPPDRLYAGRKLAFEFRRTASRLAEMQSQDYLAAAHRP